MNIYQLDPHKFPRVRRNIILSYLAMALVGLGVVYINLGEALFGQAWTLIPFVLLLFTAAGWWALRQRRKYWEEFRLRINGDALFYRAPNIPEVRIKRENITGMREIRQGLVLATPGRENTLLVPRDLRDEDYQAIKRTMEKWVDQRD